MTFDAGTFLVSGGLFVPPGVSLRGAGPGRTILHGAGAPSVVRLMGGPADGSSFVEGMTLTGGGSGLFAASAGALLRHLVVARNTGIGIVSEPGGLLSAVHVTVADNGEDGLALAGAAALRNCIVSGNGGFGVVAANGSDVTYSDLFGNAFGSGVVGGMDAPVTFIDAAALDYRVSPGSSTIDQGDPADPVDAEPAPNGSRANQGAYGNTVDAELSAVPLKSAMPADGGPSTGGACGATGLESLLLLGLIAAARRRR